jgi:hypothetical protein
MTEKPRDPIKIHEHFDETMTEVRRLLATLHYNARDQAQDKPAHERDHSRENIDSSACELGVQLSALEDLFREMSGRSP